MGLFFIVKNRCDVARKDDFMEDFEREVLDRLKTIEVKLDNYDKTKEQVYQNQRDILELKNITESHQKDIDALKENNKWLARTIAGTAITAVFGIVVILIKLGMGV